MSEKQKELFLRVNRIFEQYDTQTRLGVLVAMVSSASSTYPTEKEEEEFIEWVVKGIKIGSKQLRKSK